MNICHAQFTAVGEAFEEGFTAGREVGASVAVWHRGDWVVNLIDGYQDRKRTTPWQADTLVCFFSVSKALTATCLLQAVDAGLAALDAPVAKYWPEFAQAGKQDITLRQVLGHQAGLPGVRQPLEPKDLYNFAHMTHALAAEPPWWPPGTQHGYHARTFGFLVGEILQRVSGLSVGQWMRQKICEPLGLDVHIGLSEKDLDRCADMIPARINLRDKPERSPAMQQMFADFADVTTPTGAAFQNPKMGAGYMNTAEFRQAEIPALNGHGTAADVAKFMAALPQLLSSQTLSRATTTLSQGPDMVLKSVSHYGLGYMLHDDEAPLGWSGCLGHAGAGGSLAFCDPQRQLGFAFFMNQMQEGVVTGGDTATACVEALKGCLN